MTTPRTSANYGAPKQDAAPIAEPTKYVSGAEYARLVDDVSQMTCTATRAWVHFPTALVNGAVTPSAGRGHWGISALLLPTVARTGAGVYTVTYPASWTDNSGTIDAPSGASEPIAFVDSSGSVHDATAGVVQTTESSNVLTVYIFDMAGAASDLGGGVTIRVEAR